MSEKEKATITAANIPSAREDNNLFANNAFAAKLKADTERLINSKSEMPEPQKQKAEELLATLLMDVQREDFDKIINPTGDAEKKPSYGERYVVVIEKLLELAKSKKWGVCKNGAFVYLYNGAYWQVLDMEILKQFLSRAAYLMGLPEYHTKQVRVADLLLKQFDFTGFQPIPESDKVLINLQNGTLEFGADGRHELRNFDRRDFLKYQLPFAYDEKATAPTFQKFLNEVLPDKASQTVLAEYCGFVFAKNLKIEKALILLGTGANGKSVFFDVITALLGRANVTNYSISRLCDDTLYYAAMLQNALVNYGSELGNSRQFKANFDKFKQLCSGEPVEARLPYGTPFIISNYARLMFNANTLPRDVEQTEAYFRRFLIIPFGVTIPPEKQDKELAKKIIATDLPGVLNWVLDGLKRVVSQGDFSECKASEEALEQYKVESNSVLLFLQENEYRPSDTGRIERKELYEGYKSFCNGDGYKYCSKREFSDRLKNAQYRFVKSCGIWYVEIGNLTENTQEVDNENTAG